MTRFARALALSSLSACFALVLGAPADAATRCHCVHTATHHHGVHHATHHHAMAAPVSNTRTAQGHLINLGYYKGRADGKLGPQTRKAIKNFQRDHGLKADGVLGPKTMRALADADSGKVIGTHSFKTNDVVNSALPSEDVGSSDFATSLNGGTRKMNSRYASVDVNESGTGGNKSYNVTVNGQSVLAVDGQPSVIGISPTYDLGNEDVMIFTSYSQAEPNCLYRTHVLMLNNEGSKMADVDNCTRTNQARVDGGSLIITFPEPDANRAVGATYRVEGMGVERL